MIDEDTLIYKIQDTLGCIYNWNKRQNSLDCIQDLLRAIILIYFHLDQYL